MPDGIDVAGHKENRARACDGHSTPEGKVNSAPRWKNTSCGGAVGGSVAMLIGAKVPRDVDSRRRSCSGPRKRLIFRHLANDRRISRQQDRRTGVRRRVPLASQLDSRPSNE